MNCRVLAINCSWLHVLAGARKAGIRWDARRSSHHTPFWSRHGAISIAILNVVSLTSRLLLLVCRINKFLPDCPLWSFGLIYTSKGAGLDFGILLRTRRLSGFPVLWVRPLNILSGNVAGLRYARMAAIYATWNWIMPRAREVRHWRYARTPWRHAPLWHRHFSIPSHLANVIGLTARPLLLVRRVFQLLAHCELGWHVHRSFEGICGIQQSPRHAL
mmetsp:Transcript_110608/g.195899  ORF Transcript_110608/g.195899 Transcript_110608/m.195899 type:complete len:217 (-) Transcript_110608:114-764(-)